MLNFLKSKIILGLIFKNLNNRKKLKIVKCNKNLMHKLNITLRNFQDYLLLKEINHRYKLNIEDIDIEKLNISEKLLNDNFIDKLSKIDFYKLKELSLENNYISELDIYDEKPKKVNCDEIIKEKYFF